MEPASDLYGRRYVNLPVRYRPPYTDRRQIVTNGWENREVNPIVPQMASQAPIASFSYGIRPGLVAVKDTLTASTYGITIQEWTSNGTWTRNQTPVVMSTVRNYTSIATNSSARAFALVDGTNGSEVWEYQMGSDLTTWSKVGRVMTGSK